MVDEHATVFAEVRKVDERRLRPKLLKTDVTVVDGSGRTMRMALFNRYKANGELRPGRRAFFSGKVERFGGTVQLANPDWQLVDDEAGVVADEFAGSLVPLYPATAKASTFTLSRSVTLVLDGRRRRAPTRCRRSCAASTTCPGWTARCAASTGRPAGRTSAGPARG